jgi:hypothetical protein
MMAPGLGKAFAVVEALVLVVVSAKLVAPVTGENSLLLTSC